MMIYIFQSLVEKPEEEHMVLHIRLLPGVKTSRTCGEGMGLDVSKSYRFQWVPVLIPHHRGWQSRHRDKSETHDGTVGGECHGDFAQWGPHCTRKLRTDSFFYFPSLPLTCISVPFLELISLYQQPITSPPVEVIFYTLTQTLRRSSLFSLSRRITWRMEHLSLNM